MLRWLRRWKTRRQIRRLCTHQTYRDEVQSDYSQAFYNLSIDQPLATWLPQLEAHLQDRASEGVVW